jgi:uncharacterized protein
VGPAPERCRVARRAMSDVFEVLEDGSAVLSLHVQPGAARTALVGRHGGALKVRVSTPPEGGRANTAVVRLVAEALGMRRRDVELIGGATSRHKRLRLCNIDPAVLRQRLEQAMDG